VSEQPRIDLSAIHEIIHQISVISTIDPKPGFPWQEYGDVRAYWSIAWSKFSPETRKRFLKASAPGRCTDRCIGRCIDRCIGRCIDPCTSRCIGRCTFYRRCTIYDAMSSRKMPSEGNERRCQLSLPLGVSLPVAFSLKRKPGVF